MIEPDSAPRTDVKSEPLRTITTYYGRLVDPDGNTREMALDPDGVPFAPIGIAVMASFTNQSIINPDLSKVEKTIASTTDCVLLRPRVVNPARMRVRDSDVLPAPVVTIDCVQESGEVATYSFPESAVLTALSIAHESPCITPKKDKFKVGDHTDERHPIVITTNKGNALAEHVLLLKPNNREDMDGATSVAFKSFTANVLTSIFNGISLNGQLDTERGRHYVGVLSSIATSRPEQFDQLLSKLKTAGIDVEELRRNIDGRIDTVQDRLTGGVKNLTDRFDIGRSAVDGLLTTVNPELAKKFGDLDSEVLFEIVTKMAKFREVEK